MYIADDSGPNVRLVKPSGIISTIAGDVTQGYSGDCGYSTAAALYNPVGIAFDATGNVYISDQENNVIRKLTYTCYANAGPNVNDNQTCSNTWSVTIGTPSVTCLSYTWSPASGTNYSLTSTSVAQPNVVFTNTVSPAPIFTVTVTGTGCSTSTSTVQVTPIAVCGGCCREAAGIATLNQTTSSFAVYPNPSTAQITVSLYDKADYIRIIDMQGRTVYEAKNTDAGDFKLDISQYTKGIYFVMAKIGDKLEKQKLVVE